MVKADRHILLATQIDATDDDPAPDAIYKVGTLASVLQLLKLPDGTVKVLVEARAGPGQDLHPDRGLLRGRGRGLLDSLGDQIEAEALARSVVSEFENYVKLNKKVSPEVVSAVTQIDEPAKLADTIASHLAIKIADKQAILEIPTVAQRLEKVLGLMESEISVLQVEKRIRTRVKRQMEDAARVLPQRADEGDPEGARRRGRPRRAGRTRRQDREDQALKEAREKAMGELKKLRQMSPMSAEATVVRNYLDWMLGIPWGKRSKIKKDLKGARTSSTPIIMGSRRSRSASSSTSPCSSGPTSSRPDPLPRRPSRRRQDLARQVARQGDGREFVRMSLGGVRDEAEIRGHRRTYIGSMPGKIIQSMRKAKTSNPLILLDEIDKMGMDFRGDPSAALLEVLDPEQNNSFNDHYLEVDYDLSNVMFVTTANTLNIPRRCSTAWR